MPDEKEAKLEAQEEAASENSAEIAPLETAEESAEVETSKPEKLKTAKKARQFNPHDTARAESLAGLPLATFQQRLIAYSIDFLIVGTATALVVACINYMVDDVWHVHHHLIDKVQGHFKVQADVDMKKTDELVELVLVLAYFGLSVWLTNGLTLGKRLMKIRVVSLTHERITLWHSCERALGYGASMLEAGFGFFQYFIYPNRTCVHDRIAETIVVQEPRMKKEKATNKK